MAKRASTSGRVRAFMLKEVAILAYGIIIFHYLKTVTSPEANLNYNMTWIDYSDNKLDDLPG